MCTAGETQAGPVVQGSTADHLRIRAEAGLSALNEDRKKLRDKGDGAVKVPSGEGFPHHVVIVYRRENFFTLIPAKPG